MKKSLAIGDVLLVIFLIVSSVCIYISKFSFSSKDLQLTILSDKKEERFSLLKDFEILRNDVKIVVQKKKVFVAQSSCKNKNCIKFGKISRSGQIIICAPNKVVIKIVAQNLPIDTLGF